METNPSISALRRGIARLVAAMMVADRRLSADEVDEAARLDNIGLGLLSPLVHEELEGAARVPIDIEGACTLLSGTGPALIGTVLSVLAGVAMSDGAIDEDEASLFTTVARRLGAGMQDIEDYLESEEEEPTAGGEASAPPLPAAREATPGDDGANALRALGLGATASRAEIDAAYLGFVERYDLTKVAPLGPEFVLLAVRKLAELSELYEIARDAAKA